MKIIKKFFSKIETLDDNIYVHMVIIVIRLTLIYNLVVNIFLYNIMDTLEELILAGDKVRLMQFTKNIFILYILFLFIKNCYKIVVHKRMNTIISSSIQGSDVLFPILTPTERTSAAHEAGHWTMAILQGIPVREISIKSGQTVIKDNYICNVSNFENVSKIVKVLYAGLAAEQLLLGVAGYGCMGSKDADLERAETLLERYILVTGNMELTLNYRSQKTNEKIAALSKQIRQEVMIDLTENKEKLEKNFNQLLEKKEIIL